MACNIIPLMLVFNDNYRQRIAVTSELSLLTLLAGRQCG